MFDGSVTGFFDVKPGDEPTIRLTREGKDMVVHPLFEVDATSITRLVRDFNSGKPIVCLPAALMVD